jgi:hypothetical protein
MPQLPTIDFVEVKECVRSKAEESDRRFCFEVELSTTQGRSVDPFREAEFDISFSFPPSPPTAANVM